MTLNRVRLAARMRAGRVSAPSAPFYPTDLSDEQWGVLEPLLPVMLCGTPLGGRRNGTAASAICSWTRWACSSPSPVTPASAQDHAGAALVLKRARARGRRRLRRMVRHPLDDPPPHRQFRKITPSPRDFSNRLYS